MSCTRGEASPNAHTKLRLFADSGGFCQNPACVRPLFVDAGTENLHIAEMAHIFAASDKGPRAKSTIRAAERGAYENLVLLCPTCHTIIDKTPSQYPDAMVRNWKATHKTRIAELFGVVSYPSRADARQAIEPILRENRAIFDTYGPMTDARFNPESEIAVIWRKKVRSKILPNNRKLLRIVDANRHHLNTEEHQTLEAFRQHVDDLEARHLGEEVVAGGATFPPAMSDLLGGGSEQST